MFEFGNGIFLTCGKSPMNNSYKNLVTRSIVSLLLLFGLLKAQNTNISLERIAAQKWLNQRNITCIAQDGIGYIWFGTNNGLYRFDGYEVTEYRHDPYNLNTIAHNNVNCIYADKQNVLWIGTWGGLTKFVTATGRFTRFTHDPRNLNSISSSDVRAIVEDGSGNLWIGTFGGGLNKLNKAVITIVNGMRNSTHSELARITSVTLRIRVRKWPMVKAVTRINTLLQSSNR
jgi:ligand-binding sensor domain-containing protein